MTSLVGHYTVPGGLVDEIWLTKRSYGWSWADPSGQDIGITAGSRDEAIDAARERLAGFTLVKGNPGGPYDKDLQRARARDKRQLSESAKKREAERRYQWLQEARGVTPRSAEVEKLQRAYPVGSTVTGRFPGAGEGLYATVQGYDPGRVQAPLVLSTAGGIVSHASPADVRVTRRAVMNPKLTQVQRKWIQAVLANDEASSDEELIAYFIENGLTAEQAADVVAQRGEALRDIRWRLRNPEEGAAEVYEEFHGRPADHIEVIEETEHWHEYLAELGELREMKINTLTNLAATFDFHKDPPVLSSSEDRTSMYLVGGDQSIDLGSIKMSGEKWTKDKMVIGVITQLTYRTEKGFDKFQKLNYYHDVGEESGVQPLLVYRTRDKRLEIVGGQYLVEPRGIVN